MKSLPRLPYAGALGIRGRLTLWFVLAALGAVVIGGAVVYGAGIASIQGTLGQTYCQIASHAVGELENRAANELRRVAGLATDQLTTEVALESNAVYLSRSPSWIQQHVARLNAEWQRSDTVEQRLELLHPQLSYRLGVLAGLRPKVVRRLSVYDRSGVLVATSLPPARRSAAPAWFKGVSNEQKHFSYVDYLKVDGLVRLVVPVWGGIEVAGYVAADLTFVAWAGQARDIRFGETGEAVLVDYAGVPLEGPARAELIAALAQTPPVSGAAAEAAEGAGSEPYWVALKEAAGWLQWPFWQRLACVAPITSVNLLRARFELPEWAVVVTQAPGESYAALSRSLIWLGVAGIAGMIVLGLGGALLARLIAAPIEQLRAQVQRFAAGDRAWAESPDRADEIGDLVREFADMAGRVTASENELRAYRESLEREVEARTREIRDTQGLAVMGRMASMIAHDLRNALSTIKMNLQILARRHAESFDPDREHCTMGLDQVAYMDDIMRDMLSFARPERLRRDWYDVGQLVDEALAGVSHLAEARGVAIVHQAGPGLPKVNCDRVKVVEVLRNLIENAAQATPPGGRITVAARLLAENPEAEVEVVVDDTGEGVAEAVREEIFEPFFTTRTKGTGLGLAIVKRIIEQHHGAIDLQTRPGQGTRVAFTLPTTALEG
ncbi:MAG TPA: ATP-binding protein [Alphaproteobacteria bacterium]|nr:ATP-binding protein [Alphaproteobacteria bacterium]MDP7429022.1 ATP-binding protein [Alphaproteobacteria bacterium]HJM50141.1 ATP-binding protein [Alphaproteobacteria bacterium]